MTGAGPLDGVRVVHIASLGPGPFAAMLLADMGAAVIIIDRIDSSLEMSSPASQDPRRRGQRSIRLDLKSVDARPVVERLVRSSDVLIEGMRPGVAERLGIAPSDCAELNPRLVYGRMTGWGQMGPLAQRAGHDVNYIALSGALEAMGAPGTPPPLPLNLLGDYAGGGTYLALGIVASLLRRQRTGLGDVVDAAITDGVASLTASMFGMLAAGRWSERGTNLFDGSAPFYRTYETRDRRYVAVGAIEPAFYRQLLNGLGLDHDDWPQYERSTWPQLTEALAETFRAKDRDDWAAVFAESDACVSPVLNLLEAPQHPHHRARGTYVRVNGAVQPAPAPKFAAAGVTRPASSPDLGEHTGAILMELGFDALSVDHLRHNQAVA